MHPEPLTVSSLFKKGMGKKKKEKEKSTQAEYLVVLHKSLNTK